MAKSNTPVMRSYLGQVRGLGAGGSGVVEHWRAERVTSIALVPLSIWFVVSVIRLLGATQPEVAAWVAHPVNTVLLLALIIMTFHHMQLGLQVVIGDYIHSKPLEYAATLANKGAALLLGLFAAVAVLKMSF